MALASGLLPANAWAASASVTFTGKVEATCSITIVDGAGKLVPDATARVLSSKAGGGKAAKVDVTTTGGTSVSIGATPSTTVPTTDTTTTTWVPTYAMTGAQSVAETGASTPMVGAGTRNVDIHLVGTKTGTDTFMAGDYSATVTVTCQ
ncbi:hypothetical protein [Aureimonas sp. ME7]|uniref:hypothetical protein n=1 Tax=Aureimonas sp. ME7 TaxID=2744252 RepID=UPI0015F9C2B8|nr:hypothetical protein [Aureimonas sp. ME7]